MEGQKCSSVRGDWWICGPAEAHSPASSTSLSSSVHVYSAAWSAKVFPSYDRVHPMQRCGEEIPVVLPGTSWKGAECRALYQWWGCVNKLIELWFKGVHVSGALFIDVCLAWDGATAREWCLREVGHFCPGKSHPSVHWGGPLLNLVTYSTPYKNYAKGLFFRKRGFFFCDSHLKDNWAANVIRPWKMQISLRVRISVATAKGRVVSGEHCTILIINI